MIYAKQINIYIISIKYLNNIYLTSSEKNLNIFNKLLKRQTIKIQNLLKKTESKLNYRNVQYTLKTFFHIYKNQFTLQIVTCFLHQSNIGLEMIG